MAVIASVLLAVVQGVLLFCLLYQYLLAAASIRQPRRQAPNGTPGSRFAVVIPAHNEGSVLAATLEQLRAQAYPVDLFDIHVVADHCSDDTAEVAAREGAVAHERDTLPRGRKVYALQWLLERILGEKPGYDAVAVFDADSLIDPAFLGIMDAHLQAGKRVLQGQHIVSNPDDSMLAAMAAVDMRLNNRLRNQSRTNLGLSCRLMGDAMVFDARVLRAHGWQGESLTEDREYGYELLLQGMRVHYVPQARSYGQAASSWRQAEPQRLRWYQGLVAMQRRLAGPLLAGAVRRRSPALLDGALELLVPGYSFLVAASTMNLALALGFHAFFPRVHGFLGAAGSAALLIAWVLYPVVGLTIDRAPAWAYKALLLGPAYLVWRLWIAMLVRLRGERIGWIRTRRREEAA